MMNWFAVVVEGCVFQVTVFSFQGEVTCCTTTVFS